MLAKPRLSRKAMPDSGLSPSAVLAKKSRSRTRTPSTNESAARGDAVAGGGEYRRSSACAACSSKSSNAPSVSSAAE
jgi:hypothetical protein